MGIINVTPDSFYASSRIQSENELLDKAGKMIEDGATHFTEVGPGKVLQGLVKKVNQTMETVSA